MAGNEPVDSPNFAQVITAPLLGVGRNDDALRMCHAVFNKYPNKAWVAFSLGEAYKTGKEPHKALYWYRKAMELKPDNPWFAYGLATTYRRLKEYEKEANVLETLLKSDPTFRVARDLLAECYSSMGNQDKQIQVLKDNLVTQQGDVDPVIVKNLIRVLKNYGRDSEIETYASLIKERPTTIYSPGTIRNYRWIVDRVIQRGIWLFAMQYPIVSVEPLKEILKGTTSEKLRFVENRENFLQALKEYSDSELFTDHFAGDFGHMTKLGNQVLAEHLADEIINNLKSISQSGRRAGSLFVRL